jgi:hypothetical protein
MRLTFVETPVFTARWARRLNDESLRSLQVFLLDHLEAGDMMRGCGLLRKLRYGDPTRGKGKRGGVRVVYMYTPQAARVDLITVYGKDEKDDLDAQELRLLCQLARSMRNEIIARLFG